MTASAERIKRDLALATSADVGRKLLGYVVLAILARTFDASSMGQLFFAVTLASMAAVFTELGTHRYLVRKIAQDEPHALRHLSEVLSLRLPATLAAFTLLNLLALGFMRERLPILFLAALFTMVGDLYYTFGCLFLGLRRLGYRLATGLIDLVLLIVLVAYAVRHDFSLAAVLWCYVIAEITMVASTALVVRFAFGRFRLTRDPARLGAVMRESLPFFVMGSLGLLLFKVDTLLLGLLRSSAEVARYEAAYKFLEVSRFAVRPAGMVFFPLSAQLVAREDWTGFFALGQRLALGAGGIGLVVAAAAMSLAPWLVPLVWGPAYGSSIPILRVLFLAAPFVFLSFVGTFLAQALHLERLVVRIVLASVVGNILLNALVIPRFGALGAAWTTVASETTLAICLTTLVARARVRA
jgi:O-antigen/teichoic acid export membrane protein